MVITSVPQPNPQDKTTPTAGQWCLNIVSNNVTAFSAGLLVLAPAVPKLRHSVQLDEITQACSFCPECRESDSPAALHTSNGLLYAGNITINSHHINIRLC